MKSERCCSIELSIDPQIIKSPKMGGKPQQNVAEKQQGGG
jgi:hypothetical protein